MGAPYRNACAHERAHAGSLAILGVPEIPGARASQPRHYPRRTAPALSTAEIAYVSLLVGHIIGHVAHLRNAIVHRVIVEQVVAVMDVVAGVERRRCMGAADAAATC